MNRQTDRLRDNKISRRNDDRQINIQTNIKTNKHTNKHTYILIYTHTDMHTNKQIFIRTYRASILIGFAIESYKLACSHSICTCINY